MTIFDDFASQESRWTGTPFAARTIVAIKEMGTMQKRMDEMQTQLDLAHSKVGDVVSLASPITPSASKVRLKLL